MNKVEQVLSNLIDTGNDWGSLSASEWLILLRDCGEENQSTYLGKCDAFNGWDKFTAWDVIELLKDLPQFMNRLHWNKYNAKEWACLLEEFPSLVVKCDMVNGWKDFGKMIWDLDVCSENDMCWAENCWAHILIIHPEFADRCDKFDGWIEFKAKDWVRLLTSQAQFDDRCGKVNGWNEFEPKHWVVLLKARPMFFIHCDACSRWQDFSGFDWVELLRTQPTFSKECDLFDGWRKISCTSCGRWAELLECQPEFAAKCDEFDGWKVFDGFDWFRLLSSQPRFASKCNLLNGWYKLFYFTPEVQDNLSGYGEREECTHKSFFMIAEYEETFSRERFLSAENCQHGLPVDCWMPWSDCEAELELRNERIDIADEEMASLMRNLNKSFWMYFLNQKPAEALSKAARYDMGNIWAALTIDDWKVAIKNKSTFVRCVTNFDSKDCLEYDPQNDFFDEKFWDALIAAWPDIFDNLKLKTWSYLIRHRPDWSVHMNNDDWVQFDEKDWVKLLHPHWQYLAKTTVPPGDLFWWSCLSKAPQFVNLCEQYGGWGKLPTNHLCDLMTTHLELTEHCVKHIKWDELSCDNWIALITHPIIGKSFIQECERHRGWTKFVERNHEWSCLGWVELLKACPHLVDKCSAVNGWGKFNGNDWQILLSERPQLACFCDSNNGWQKFEEENWMRLINIRPNFVAAYNEKWLKRGADKQSAIKIVERAKEFVRRENRKRIALEIGTEDDYSDWREESGWNDVYGSDVEMSDIIEFRD